MKLLRNIILVCLLAILAGCATGRTADLRDCGRASLGLGFGLGAHLELGALTHPAIGIKSTTWRIGFENRDAIGIWQETEYYTPYLIFCEQPESYVRSSKVSGQTAGYWLNLKPSYVDHNTNTFNRITDLELGASALLVSARVGINPLEIVDFILGFVGFDIANDDPKNKGKEKPTTESTPTK